MSNHSARHMTKYQNAQKKLRKAFWGLIAGAIATILAWVILSIDIFGHKNVIPAAIFAGVMTFIFIINCIAIDKLKKNLQKYPKPEMKPKDAKGKAQAQLAKQKKKGKTY